MDIYLSIYAGRVQYKDESGCVCMTQPIDEKLKKTLDSLPASPSTIKFKQLMTVIENNVNSYQQSKNTNWITK